MRERMVSAYNDYKIGVYIPGCVHAYISLGFFTLSKVAYINGSYHSSGSSTYTVLQDADESETQFCCDGNLTHAIITTSKQFFIFMSNGSYVIKGITNI